jgi:nucleotide-binding universal stress UspA family protein
VIDEGNAAAVVLKAAQMEGGDLIVTGTAGISPLGHPLMGSTTARLVAHAMAPVLVVKKRGIPPYARIIVATDLSDASVAALETAMALFQPSQITLYHARPTEGSSPTRRPMRPARVQTREMKREHSRPGTWQHQLTVSTSKSALAMRHAASPSMPHRRKSILSLRERTGAPDYSGSCSAALRWR